MGSDSLADALWKCLKLAESIRQSLLVCRVQTRSFTKLTNPGIYDPASGVSNNSR